VDDEQVLKSAAFQTLGFQKIPINTVLKKRSTPRDFFTGYRTIRMNSLRRDVMYKESEVVQKHPVDSNNHSLLL